MKYPNNEEVRAWARKRGMQVGDRARLPQRVIDAWDRSHPKRKYVPEEAHHGTVGGFVVHKCRCGDCRRRFARQQIAYYTKVLNAA